MLHLHGTQTRGDDSTGEYNLYNEIYVEVGMWISDESGNTTLKIIPLKITWMLTLASTLTQLEEQRIWSYPTTLKDDQ